MIYRITLSNNILGSLILSKSPKGVDNIYPTLIRGENHGLSVETEVKLEFFCNGAGKEFVDQVHEEQGVDAEITIDIKVYCGCDGAVDAPDYSIDYSDDYGSIIGQCNNEDFQDFYTGVLELITIEQIPEFTKVNIRPTGILQTVKNRLDTKIDLLATETIDGTSISPYTYAPYDLTLHSKAILTQAILTAIESPESRIDTYTPRPPVDTLYVQLVWNFIEADEIGITMPVNDITSTEDDTHPGPIYTNNSGDYETVNLSFDLQGQITDVIASDRSYNLAIVCRVSDPADPDNLIYSSTTIKDYGVKSPLSSQTMTQDVNEQVDISVIIPDGHAMYIMWVFANYDNISAPTPPVATITQTFDVCEVDFSIESVTDSSIGKAFAVSETGSHIARCITGVEDSFRSEYFGRKNSQPYAYEQNGCGAFRSFINGFLIRGFPITGDNARTIRMSMNDFFNGLNPIDNLGMGIEKQDDSYYIRVEPKEFFYDLSNVIMQISNIPNLKKYEAPEYYYSNIYIGYGKWETEFTNGLDEFNSKREYYTGIKSVDNKLEAISDLVTSGYRIEIARRNQYTDSFTKDTQYDEDNYLVCLNRSVDVDDIPDNLDEAEKDENFADVQNILSPETSYNLRVSPARNLLRWNGVINSGLIKYPGREIKLTSGEGNYKMTSQFDGDVCSGNWNNESLSEGQNIQWDDNDNTDSSPIWIPQIIEFDYPLKFNEWVNIVNNGKGVFEISEWEDDYEKGFILEVQYRPDGISKFKLLKANS
jgi:hypothetical protein